MCVNNYLGAFCENSSRIGKGHNDVLDCVLEVITSCTMGGLKIGQELIDQLRSVELLLQYKPLVY